SIGGAIEKWMGEHPLITGAAGLVTGGALARATAGMVALGGRPLPGAAGRELMLPGGVRRTHLNKATYVRRGGGTRNLTPGVVVKGTEFVPTRRMNVANPRALRRSLRRVAGFAKLTKRVRHAVSMAASACGVHRRAAKGKAIRRR